METNALEVNWGIELIIKFKKNQFEWIIHNKFLRKILYTGYSLPYIGENGTCQIGEFYDENLPNRQVF